MKPPKHVTAKQATRVMLVDDHEVVRGGLRALLSIHPDLTIVAEAATAREAIEEADRVEPDVVVMDVRLSDGSGVEATREIRSRHPETKVMMLTSFADDEAMIASIMAGASGYVLKQIRGNDIVASIRSVGEGNSLLDAASTEAIIDRLRNGKHLFGDERLARLSAREERVLEGMTQGLTNREIGEGMGVAEKTVKNYVSSVLLKLDVGRRAEAAAYLARHSQQEP